MAEEPKKPPDRKPQNQDNVDLSTHALVDKLNPDGGIPEGRVPLIGFIGPSRKDGHIRVYRDLTFRSYYEVPKDAVAHTIPVDRDDPDSPTKVLVPYDTPIEIVEVTTHHVEAGYVAGSIAQGHLGYTATGGSLPGAITLCTTAITCPSQCPPRCTGVTTVVTCNVTCPDPGPCTTLYTCPSACPQQQCDGITTFVTCNVTNPQICHHAQAQAGAAGGTGNPCTGYTTYVTCPPYHPPCQGPTTYVTCPDVPAHLAAAGGTPACTGITTYVTCPPPGGGGNQCTGVTTYVTCPPHQPPCNGPTTYATCPNPPHIAAAPAAANAAQPLCITLYTAYPSWCPPPVCVTLLTAVPTHCGPRG